MAKEMCSSKVVSLSMPSCVVFLMLLMVVSPLGSDFAGDKKRCNDRLTALSPCLGYVGGNAKAPAPACCSSLGEKVNSTKKCLCLLIKDRNDPQLPLNINATLALTLPSICHAAANVSDCPEILHLAPNSSDALVFEQFAANTTAGTPTSSSFTLRRKTWLRMSMVGGIFSALMCGV